MIENMYVFVLKYNFLNIQIYYNCFKKLKENVNLLFKKDYLK